MFIYRKVNQITRSIFCSRILDLHWFKTSWDWKVWKHATVNGTRNHRIIERSELEGTNKDLVQVLSPHRTTPRTNHVSEIIVQNLLELQLPEFQQAWCHDLTHIVHPLSVCCFALTFYAHYTVYLLFALKVWQRGSEAMRYTSATSWPECLGSAFYYITLADQSAFLMCPWVLHKQTNKQTNCYNFVMDVCKMCCKDLHMLVCRSFC